MGWGEGLEDPSQGETLPLLSENNQTTPKRKNTEPAQLTAHLTPADKRRRLLVEETSSFDDDDFIDSGKVAAPAPQGWWSHSKSRNARLNTQVEKRPKAAPPKKYAEYFTK